MLEVHETPVFARWFAGLRDRSAKGRIAARLLHLAAGHFGDTSPVGGAVHELRLHFGPGYRVYFTRQDQRIVLLLCGGDKDSQRRDIARALHIAATME